MKPDVIRNLTDEQLKKAHSTFLGRHLLKGDLTHEQYKTMLALKVEKDRRQRVVKLQAAIQKMKQAQNG